MNVNENDKNDKNKKETMNEKMKNVIEKMKKPVKVFLHYFIITVTMIACFTVGYYFNALKSYTNHKPEVIKRSDVTIAIDENSNFMIIAKEDGSYTILEDSVGRAIFDIYAKNIWAQTTQEVTKVEVK